MFKRIYKFGVIAAAVLMMASCLGIAACGSGNGNDIDFDDQGNVIPQGTKTVINFWGWADRYEEIAFTKIVQNFNKKYEGVIEVRYTPKSSTGYSDNFVASMISGPDVAYADERYFKTYADQGILYDVNEFYNQSVANYKASNGVNGLDESDMYPYTTSRYRYNPVTTTSNASDPLYGLAKDLAPTAIFFNPRFFTAAGIEIVSETEDEIRAYNAAHSDAKKKIKAYYEQDGKWYFNKSIAMNWEECRDLSKKLMTDGGVQYGFFSEWWFNYGFTVGGDCIEYVPTTDSAFNGGRYIFTLGDETKNWIVKDDAQPVTVNGNTYRAGEVISYNDKTALTAAQKESCNQLPSQREAFTEFVRLSLPETMLVDNVTGVYNNVSDFYGADANGNIYGYGITPNPNTMQNDGRNGYFSSGKVAMLVTTASAQRQFSENMSGQNSFDVAPMPVYKAYSEDGTEVLVHGVPGAHSGSVAVVMNRNTRNPNATWLFMEYIASKEGQLIQAEEGFAVPYYRSLAGDPKGEFLTGKYSAANAKIFADACEYESPADWWYLKDKLWIDDWARVLNSDVRNGKKSLTQFYESPEYKATQGLLDSYTKK